MSTLALITPGRQARMAELPSFASIMHLVAALMAFNDLAKTAATDGSLPVLRPDRERALKTAATARIVVLLGVHRERAARRTSCSQDNGEEGWKMHFE